MGLGVMGLPLGSRERRLAGWWCDTSVRRGCALHALGMRKRRAGLTPGAVSQAHRTRAVGRDVGGPVAGDGAPSDPGGMARPGASAFSVSADANGKHRSNAARAWPPFPIRSDRKRLYFAGGGGSWVLSRCPVAVWRQTGVPRCSAIRVLGMRGRRTALAELR